MYILGLSAFGKNPAACLLKEGKLVAFAEEERFLRIKGAHGLFPSGAVKYLLSEAKISLSRVKKVAVGWDCIKYTFKMPLFFAKSWLRYGLINRSTGTPAVLNELLRYNPKYFEHNLKLNLANICATNKIPPVEFVPHHLAHAASTFYASGFSRAGILVIDGSGEERTTSIFKGNDLEIKEVSHINIPHSLGWFYAATAAYLGFIPYRQEGQVMGLAAYGEPKSYIFEKMKKLIEIENSGNFKVNPSYTRLGKHSFDEHYSNKMVKLLGQPRFPGQQINQRHKDIAYAAQALLEEAALLLTKKVMEKTNSKNLCLAGGVALNCKMNGEILLSGLADEIFIQPISNDAGSSLGAAMIIAKEEGFDSRFTMQHTYWGPSFNQDEVKKALDQAKVKYSKPKSIEKKAAEAISKGKIVAWFKGRMEAGPRALGARSILANPKLEKMKDAVNSKVKHRESWRPFCPSVIQEVAPDYLTNLTKKQKEARFMIVTYKVKGSKQKEISAVLHVDGTTRPQTVNKKINPNYYSLLEEVGKRTGIPMVLNTSFNVKGEPIICTPEQALRCFASTGLDAMAIEDFWIEKK